MRNKMELSKNPKIATKQKLVALARVMRSAEGKEFAPLNEVRALVRSYELWYKKGRALEESFQKILEVESGKKLNIALHVFGKDGNNIKSQEVIEGYNIGKSPVHFVLDNIISELVCMGGIPSRDADLIANTLRGKQDKGKSRKMTNEEFDVLRKKFRYALEKSSKTERSKINRPKKKKSNAFAKDLVLIGGRSGI